MNQTSMKLFNIIAVGFKSFPESLLQESFPTDLKIDELAIGKQKGRRFQFASLIKIFKRHVQKFKIYEFDGNSIESYFSITGEYKNPAKSLSIRWNWISDPTEFQSIMNLAANIEHLNMTIYPDKNYSITEEDIEYVNDRLKNIKSFALIVSDSSLFNIGLFKNVTDLRILNISTPVTWDLLAEKCPMLEKLALGEICIDFNLSHAIENFKKLKTLILLQEFVITEQFIVSIKRSCKYLERIEIGSSKTMKKKESISFEIEGVKITSC